jgi:cell wall-associated NlpC family hydrolase
MDRRSTPSNGRIAASYLRGKVAAEAYSDGDARQVSGPLCDLLRAPDGLRDRQLVFGDPVTVYEDRSGFSYVQSAKDGYCGYVRSAALGPAEQATHWVSAASTQLYSAADIKSRDLMALMLNSRICAIGDHEKFVQTRTGFVPKVHLNHVDQMADDPCAVALKFLGTPYLWGGNSRFGIDCSGLVQAALLACGLACPGDSDQQCETLGTRLEPDSALAKGDLLFWKGHVAMALGSEMIVHANGFHMAVVTEHAKDAIARIAQQGGGPVIAHKRL